MIMLSLVLLILLLLVCGWRGLTIFTSLGLNFGLIIIALVLVAGGFEPLVVTAIAGTLLLVVSIFMNTQQPLTARTAFLTSLIVLIGLLAIMVPFSLLAVTHGFATEDAEEIEGFSLAIGLSFQKISLMMMILSSLGAVAETSIAVASGLVELLAYQPEMTARGLFRNGLAIGEKIIATAFNTLFFSFFGSFLSLTVWFVQLGYPISKIVNHKILVGEVGTLLIGVIGVIATVPLTSWLLNRLRQHKVD